MTGAPELALNNLGLSYPQRGSEAEVVALRDITASFPAGSFTALVGPSGCGKSSLLRVLAGLLSPTQGDMSAVTQSDIGFVFQEPTLLAWRSVYENVALPLKIANRKSGLRAQEIDTRVREALTLVGLETRAKALPRELSGGMKMRVSLARALAKRPPILLMDEPFAALDELTRFRLDDDLRAIWQRQKPTIIFVTHSVTEAAYLAERALVMRAGSLHAEIKIERPKKHTDNFRAAPNFHAACAAISQALADPKEGTS
jgi:NitT/TauT family transport system ATP-binding protein